MPAASGQLFWIWTELDYIGRRATTFAQEPLVVRRITPVLRIWVFIAAFAQAVSPGVISVVDAPAAASVAVAGIRPHAEDHSSPRCPRVHQEDTCALCQFVSASFAPAADAVRSPLLQSKSPEVVRGLALAPEWLTDGTPSLPRAPPQKA